ncbi:hypothetical protein ACFW9U_28305 [Rhodococcus aetherivorans]|uniref:RipA family octameric membrane protein n=1 Tax=Rhodococcus aetherivorans TaxID=191292 RepID=UPI003672A198
MATPDDTFYWEWYKHEENLTTNRGSFFLVGQSMLFAGYAQLRAGTASASCAIYVFCVLGFFVSLLWVLVGVMHNQGIRKRLVDELNRHEPRRADLTQRGRTFFLRSFSVMAFILPVIIAAAWVSLLVSA